MFTVNCSEPNLDSGARLACCLDFLATLVHSYLQLANKSNFFVVKFFVNLFRLRIKLTSEQPTDRLNSKETLKFLTDSRLIKFLAVGKKFLLV